MEAQSNKDAPDAFVFLATPGTQQAKELVDAAARILGAKAKILPLQGVGAFIKKPSGLRDATLAAGSLRGRPPLPNEEVKTLAISYRLVASTRLDRPTISSLTEHLFQQRQSIARSEPNADFIKAPDDDQAMSAVLPNHRGAIDYLNREQVTFMDRYGDWLWLGLFAVGGLSPLFGWLAQAFARRRREAIDDVLGRLLRILSEARECSSAKELQTLTLEVDELVAKAVRQARGKTTSTRTMGALMMSIDSARQAIDDRRREIGSTADRDGQGAFRSRYRQRQTARQV